MHELGERTQAMLAISLHATNDELRETLVPLNKKYPLAELLDACNRYLEHAPRDFITFEYCMLDGVNDQPEHARQLVELVRQRVYQIACGYADQDDAVGAVVALDDLVGDAGEGPAQRVGIEHPSP